MTDYETEPIETSEEKAKVPYEEQTDSDSTKLVCETQKKSPKETVEESTTQSVMKKVSTRKRKQKKNSKKPKRRISFRATMVIVPIVVVIIAILPGLVNCGNKGQTLSDVALKKAVSVSKLSTAEFAYEGIANNVDDQRNPIYYIYYRATVNSGIDFSKIDFEINELEKTITPILPEITIDTPVIDESVIEFLPKNANIDMRDVIEICKQDATKEIEGLTSFKETSQRNLRATIEALLMPLLKDSGYSIAWGDEAHTPDSNSANQTQVLDDMKGEYDESN